jgi:tRNA threonylcarbamoyladenosine biosynthesis protein TsaB
MAEAQTELSKLDLLAVSAGPGSFTGLRVGLATVKAWSEVYKKPVVGVSRLEAMARIAGHNPSLVASCYDAQRAQLFGAMYRITESAVERLIADVVISPQGFAALVDAQAAAEPVVWVSLDPQMIEKLEILHRRTSKGDSIAACPPDLAPIIGELAQQKAARGEFSDPLSLDANYVRRSDAEIFWKGSSAGAR